MFCGNESPNKIVGQSYPAVLYCTPYKSLFVPIGSKGILNKRVSGAIFYF